MVQQQFVKDAECHSKEIVTKGFNNVKGFLFFLHKLISFCSDDFYMN